MGRSSPRYAKKKDANHPAIVKDLRDIGMVVLDCAAKGFYTDLLIGWRGVWCFFEVKDQNQLSKAQRAERALTLTDTEETLKEMAERNDLPFAIVVSSDEAIEYMTKLTT